MEHLVQVEGFLQGKNVKLAERKMYIYQIEEVILKDYLVSDTYMRFSSDCDHTCQLKGPPVFMYLGYSYSYDYATKVFSLLFVNSALFCCNKNQYDLVSKLLGSPMKVASLSK